MHKKILSNQSKKVFIGLIFLMFFIKIFDTVFSPNHIYPGRTASFAWTELLLVAILGFLGFVLAEKTAILPKNSKKYGLVKYFLLGLALGGAFIILDFFLRIGDISVGWPLNVVFYIWGGISQEVILHLFLVSFLVFVVSDLILKGKYKTTIFWIVAVMLSVVGAAGMVSAFSNPKIPLETNSQIIPFVFGFLVFGAELLILRIFKFFGFLPALFTRFGFYTVWHIIWPMIFYI